MGDRRRADRADARDDVPRIGYIHTWTSTQDEGWVRLAFDNLKVPYNYFGDNVVRQGNLRAKYDVILYPHTGGIDITGEGMPAGTPVPYKKTDLTPNIGTSPGNTDDTRGGLGRDGLKELVKFMNDGGVLITEGTPARTLMGQVTEGISAGSTDGLYAPGSVLKTLLGDKTSPILYGFDQNALGVLYNVGPIFTLGANLTAGAAGGGGRGGARPAGVGSGNMQPMAAAPQLTTMEGGAYVPVPGVSTAGVGGGRGGFPAGAATIPAVAVGGVPPAGPAGAAGAGAAAAAGGRGGRGGAGRGGGAGAAPGAAPAAADLALGTRGTPRVLLSYPTDPKDLLLSGEMAGGEALAGHPVLVDQQIGKGHIVLFGCRPFWRYETSGNYFLVFNAMLNWDHLDAGR